MKNSTVLNHQQVIEACASNCSVPSMERKFTKDGKQTVIKEVSYTEYTEELKAKDQLLAMQVIEKSFITGSQAKIHHLVHLTMSQEDINRRSKEMLVKKYTKYLTRCGHKFEDEDYTIRVDNVTAEEALALSRLHQDFLLTDSRGLDYSYANVEMPLMLEHPKSKAKVDIFVVPHVTPSSIYMQYISISNLIESCVRMNRYKDWQFVNLIYELNVNTNYTDEYCEDTTITSEVIKKILS